MSMRACVEYIERLARWRWGLYVGGVKENGYEQKKYANLYMGFHLPGTILFLLVVVFLVVKVELIIRLYSSLIISDFIYWKHVLYM